MSRKNYCNQDGTRKYVTDMLSHVIMGNTCKTACVPD